MKPLIVLISTFIITSIILKFLKHEWQWALAARIAMSIMLLFTAIGHFVFTKGMAMMLPDFIPNRQLIINATGILEIMGAIGLLIPQWRTLTAWLLIAFFVLVLPANIYAAVKNINYQTGALDGDGLSYLWFRAPLQFLFIVWVYLSSIRF